MASFAYNPRKVIFTVGGVVITNLAKDTALSFTYTDTATMMRETIQGDAVFSVRNYTSGTLTVNAEPNSNLIGVVTTLNELQRRTGGGQVALAIVDSNIPDGAAAFTATARLEQMPDFTYGEEASTMEVNFLCADVNHVAAALPSGLSAGV